jgi:lysyl-tRNA synthetase class 2
MGNASFATLRDSSGDIQIYVTKNNVDESVYEDFKTWDLGDIVGVSGSLFRTKTDELTIDVWDLEMITKSLRPMPEKFKGLTDIEARYRQRYLDLMTNNETKEVFVKRTKIIDSMRKKMNECGYLEVETPMMHPLAGGAVARPFVTQHNALGQDLYLRIAPELYLKRLIIGGFEKVFELGKIFRNEGIDQTHLPEFTMLESYQAYVDANSVMDMVEDMCTYVFKNLETDTKLHFGENTADFSGPWKRESMFDMVSEKLNIDIQFNSDFKKISKELKKQGVDFEAKSIGLLVYELFENFVEKEIIDPTFVVDYPVEVSPFAREKKDEKGVTERFELFAFGSELANGFSELIDSEDQAKRLKEQAIKKNDGDEEAHVEDEDYVEALQYGLPPTGGLGFGVDRFVMMLVGKTSIREVISFTHLKPEN